METVIDEFFQALWYLFIAVIIFFIWKTAYDNAEGGKYKNVLWKGFLYCAGIALFASVSLGNATCEETSDPLYGGCEEYSNNSYEPTTEQRVARFVYIITLLYTPVVSGALKNR